MNKIKLEFENSNGETLAGLLELPERMGQLSSFALFAHCFTCGKDIAAASRISRALAARGIAVLRFDFTGLGNSDGDFANTNFSSNVDDLVRAAAALEENYGAPQILIGHSLGGAAVLAAAGQVPDHELRGLVGLAQIVRRLQKIRDIGGKAGVGEFAIAVAQPGEIEAKDRDALVGQSGRDPCRRKDILRAGKAVGEQRVGLWFPVRQIQARRQLLAEGTREIHLFRFHGSLPSNLMFRAMLTPT